MYDTVQTLADTPLGTAVRVTGVNWDVLQPAEARRLQALGIQQGKELRPLHRGIFGGSDPIAVEIGRTVVALRRDHACAIQVVPGDPDGTE